MNRLKQFVIDLIHNRMRYGMFVLPLCLVSIQPVIAKGPDDKDKAKRFQPPTNSRPVDSARKADSPRFSPPPRQTAPDISPRLERANRNDNPRSPGFNPTSRTNLSAPPTITGPMPSGHRNPVDVNRAFRGGSPNGRANMPTFNGNTPSPKIAGPSLRVNRDPAEANRAARREPKRQFQYAGS